MKIDQTHYEVNEKNSKIKNKIRALQMPCK